MFRRTCSTAAGRSALAPWGLPGGPGDDDDDDDDDETPIGDPDDDEGYGDDDEDDDDEDTLWAQGRGGARPRPCTMAPGRGVAQIG
jgi:hypothetical protein